MKAAAKWMGFTAVVAIALAATAQSSPVQSSPVQSAATTQQPAATTPTQSAAVAAPASESSQTTPATHDSTRVIVVSLEDRKLALVEDGQVRKIYTVAVGKPSTPSPVGTFTIERRVVNPTYHHGDKNIGPGPHNPVGTRWMGLSKPGYGIHGTNEPNSIGKAASHGCIRMAKADLEEFFPMVAVGDTVELIGTRNQETAKLFGDPQTAPAIVAAPATQPVLTAETAPATVPTATTAQAPATNAAYKPAAEIVASIGAANR